MKHKTLFISYRRTDATASAGRLFDWLIRQFGRRHIFLDTEAIAPGDDFPRVLEERLAASDVVLAVIGPTWIASLEQRGRGLDHLQDYVRREIRSALERKIRVIPVLVGGAHMPQAEALPEPIRSIGLRNAVSIDDVRFERDFEQLVNAIHGRERNFQRIQLDRLKRVTYAAKWTLLLVPVFTVVMAFAVWTHVLDFLTLDSRIVSSLISAVDVISGRPQDPGVLIAAIDEDSEQKLGRKFAPGPEWRYDHARLIRRAAAAGAKAVAFDLTLENVSAADYELAQAAHFARVGASPMRVVFGIKRLDDGRPALSDPLRGDDTWGSVCLLSRIGLFVFPVAVLRDPGGPTEFFTAITPALSLVATRSETLKHVDMGRRQIVGSSPVSFSAVERIGTEWKECRVYENGDEAAMLFVRPSPLGYWRDTAKKVSYAGILEEGAVSDEWLRDRIVVVGVMKPGIDEHTVVHALTSEKVYGVELHADAIANLLSDHVVTTPTVGVQGWITVALVIAGATASVLTLSLSKRARRSILTGAAALYVLAALAFAVAGFLLNVHYDLAAFLAAHVLFRHLQLRQVPLGAYELRS